MGLHNITQLSMGLVHGLRPFIYPFGGALSESTSADAVGYTKLIFSGFPIQLIIITVLTLIKYFSNITLIWYYQISFVFCFCYDIMITCIIILTWVRVQSYADAFSIVISIICVLLLFSQNLSHFFMINNFKKNKKMVLPTVSNVTVGKDNSIVEDRQTEDNLVSFEAATQQQKQQQFQNEQQQIQIKQKKDINLYDLIQDQLTPIQYYLFKCFIIPICICIGLMIQNGRVRLIIILSTLTVSLIIHIFRLPLNQCKTLISISVIGLIATQQIINQSQINVVIAQIIIASITVTSNIFNIVIMIVSIYRSDSFKEYQIQRRNKAILQKNKNKVNLQNNNKKYKKNPIKNILNPYSIEQDQPSNSYSYQEPFGLQHKIQNHKHLDPFSKDSITLIHLEDGISYDHNPTKSNITKKKKRKVEQQILKNKVYVDNSMAETQEHYKYKKKPKRKQKLQKNSIYPKQHMNIDSISSIRQQQILQRSMSQQQESETVFKKILQDYQKYKHKRVDRQTLKKKQ